MSDVSCWREMLLDEAQCHGDDLTELVIFPETTLWPQRRWSIEPEEGATEQSTLDVTFDTGYGSAQGPSFTAWSANRVYFPLCYDGSEWVGSAPRNPCEQACVHQGGG